MDIAKITQDFATCGHKLPAAAMRAALAQWEECSSHFLALLEQFIRGEDRSRETIHILFFAVNLMAQQREHRAFAPLCTLATDIDLFEEVLGENGPTELLPRLLVSTYDGRSELLKALIENAEADEFVRSSALDALAFLTYRGDIARQATRDYLHWLHHAMQPQEENYAFVGIIDTIVHLGFVEDRPIVQDLFRRGLIDDSVLTLREFDQEIKAMTGDPEQQRRAFARKAVEPCPDIIEELGTWHWFTEAGERDEIARQKIVQRRAAQKFAAILQGPDTLPYGMAVDPLGLYDEGGTAIGSGKTGRNDPCPCGSGKKYKKCCLP
jgi:uncharacterized protein